MQFFIQDKKGKQTNIRNVFYIHLGFISNWVNFSSNISKRYCKLLPHTFPFYTKSQFIFHKFISVRTENDTIIHVPDQELEVNFSIVFALHGLGNNYPHNLQVRLRTIVWKLRKITFRFQITIQQKFREITFFTNKTLFFVFFKKYREINQLNSTKDCKLYVILLLEIRVGKIELFLRLKPRQVSRWHCKDM